MQSLRRPRALIHIQLLVVRRPVPIAHCRRVANLALELGTGAAGLQAAVLAIERRAVDRAEIVPEHVGRERVLDLVNGLPAGQGACVLGAGLALYFDGRAAGAAFGDVEGGVDAGVGAAVGWDGDEWGVA
jgi:hypothetical protein